MSLAFVPVYLRFLGIEAYGLIGFFVSFQALLSLLDLGLSSATNRELARLSVDAANAGEMRHLTRTLEVVYWAVAALIAAIVVLLAPILATHWLQAGNLSVRQVDQAIVIMGLVFAARWPFVLYTGALMGLQRQVLLNSVRIGIETLRSGGAALVLWLVSPTLDAFLAWQLGIAALASLLLAWVTWHSLPPASEKPRFQLTHFRRIWKFAAGLSGIAATVVILTQTDKIVLSKLLSLEDFGYYALAWAVAGGVGQLIPPVFSAYFPRLAQAVAKNDENAEKELYHRGSQLLSLILLPVGVVLVLFSREVLLLWTQNPVVAENTHLVLSIVVIGTMLNGLMNIPYALQLAHGWTALAFCGNVLAIIFLVPMVIVMAKTFGPAGAASVWAILNAGYVLISVQIMHRRLLKREMRAWYIRDIGLPCILVVGAVLSIKILSAGLAGPSGFALVMIVGSSYALGVAAAMLAQTGSRSYLLAALGSRSKN